MAKNEITRTCTYDIGSYTNTRKQNMLSELVSDMENAVWDFVEYLWENRIEWIDDKQRTHVFDIKNFKLALPKYLSTKGMFTDSPLTQRALKRAASQAIAIVSSAIKKTQKRLFKLAEMQQLGYESKKYRKVQRNIDRNPLIKPSRKKEKFDINFDSNCCRFDKCDDHSFFDGFLVIKSVGDKYGEIIVPIKHHTHTNKLVKRGFEQKTSWLITPYEVKSIWSKSKPENTGTEVVGGDQGKTTVLSLSDSQITRPNIHGKDLNTILEKMARRKPGSIGFKKAQDERTNYINWSIKDLDFSKIKELRLEKLRNIRKGKNSSNTLKHWTYTEINAQIYRLCEESGVRIVEQGATYRSQRCSGCGWVQKSNRRSKGFLCKSCGFSHDADINAAMNHAADLPPLQFGLWHMQLNRKGFFWTSVGIFDSYGSEITVPDIYR